MAYIESNSTMSGHLHQLGYTARISYSSKLLLKGLLLNGKMTLVVPNESCQADVWLCAIELNDSAISFLRGAFNFCLYSMCFEGSYKSQKSEPCICFHLPHATESISSLADLYRASLFASCSLLAISAGSSSSIALSCSFSFFPMLM